MVFCKLWIPFVLNGITFCTYFDESFPEKRPLVASFTTENHVSIDLNRV